jgi:hypothetical protein
LSAFRSILRYGVGPPQATDAEEFQEQIDGAVKACDERNPYKGKAYAYRETAFFPARFDEGRFDFGGLWRMAESASVDFRGWPFLSVRKRGRDPTININDGLETFKLGWSLHPRADWLYFWQLRKSGLLCVKAMLWADMAASAEGRTPFFDFDDFSMSAGEAVHCLVKLYEGKLDDSEEVVLRFKLTGVKGRVLGSSNPLRLLEDEHITCGIDGICYERQAPLADWRGGLVDHALGICRHVFLCFNVDRDDIEPNVEESRKLIEKMLARKL